HPASTPFPYTTLFRSSRNLRRRRRSARARRSENLPRAEVAHLSGRGNYLDVSGICLEVEAQLRRVRSRRDEVRSAECGKEVVERSEEHTSELQSRFDL